MKRKFNALIERNAEGRMISSVPTLSGYHTRAKTLKLLNFRIHDAIGLHAKLVFQIVMSGFRKASLILLSCAAALTSVSCFSVSYPKPSDAEREMARAFVPPPGKALVVAYRKPSISPLVRRVPTRLWIDDEPYGGNRAGTFVVAPVSKGLHLVGIDRNPDPASKQKNFNLNASAGNVYFFRQHVDNEMSGTMLIPAGGVLAPAPVASMKIYITRVSEAEGRREVAGCVQHGSIGKLSISTWP